MKRRRTSLPAPEWSLDCEEEWYVNFALDLLFSLMNQVLGGFFTALVLIPVNILNELLTGLFVPA